MQQISLFSTFLTKKKNTFKKILLICTSLKGEIVNFSYFETLITIFSLELCNPYLLDFLTFSNTLGPDAGL